MEQPNNLLDNFTRIRTHETLSSTSGLLVTERHLSQRKPNAVGTICGIVGGHGGDVYFVSHIGDVAMAVYCFDEFELEPVVEPRCGECHGGGIDFPVSSKSNLGTACSWCHGTGSAPPMPRPTAFERVQKEDNLG